MNTSATLALANHRPESIDLAKALMARHDAVILEEAPDRLFRQMLVGKKSIAAYLQTLDIEYPQFGRQMSMTLRQLHANGIRIYQVEPFIEHLVRIHELFADGGSPADLPAGTQLHSVYAAERSATSALLDFYRVAVTGRFDRVVEAVKTFARADARRFAMRDRMRAAAIVELLGEPASWYIEAGPMHYPLWSELKRRLPTGYPLKVKFLMADAVRAMGFRSHLYGPGDLLTLLYRFHPGHGSRRADLLAARALIYNKLIAKEEIAETAGPFPHTRDELRTGAIVRRLSLADCRRLYPLVRLAGTAGARQTVRRYLDRFSDSGRSALRSSVRRHRPLSRSRRFGSVENGRSRPQRKEEHVEPIPFNPVTDVAPIPFEQQHLELARQLKQRGLVWKPHVGCFVWDPQECIEVASPFPLRVYFILSLPRFVGIFGSPEAVADKLVWLPTWHQARLLALRFGVRPDMIAGLWPPESVPSPGEELVGLYRLIRDALETVTAGP